LGYIFDHWVKPPRGATDRDPSGLTLGCIAYASVPIGQAGQPAAFFLPLLGFISLERGRTKAIT
jgi:hypothetical protein